MTMKENDLLETVGIGFLFLDEKLSVIDSTDFVQRALSLEAEDIGKKISILPPFVDLGNSVIEKIEGALANSLPIEDEFFQFKKDNYLLKICRTDNTAVPKGAKLTLTLIKTENQDTQASDALRETSKLLEQKAAQLEQSNKDLEQFAFIASHDLQTPLRHISTYSDLIMEKFIELGVKGDEIKWCESVINSSDLMRELINDILLLSRVGNKSLDYISFKAQEVISVVSDMFTHTGGRFSIDVDCTVRADRALIRQVFQNIIQNSIKFKHPDREIDLKIYFKEKDDSFQFFIEDNGVGIEKNLQKDVFKIFQRGSSPQDGSGIGLAICEKIIHKHGGEIGFTSTEGEGTTFNFTLPK